MSVKDNRVDVRYHRNTDIVLFDTRRHLCPKRCYCGSNEIKPSRAKYLFNCDVFEVSFKAKYRMEC